jgi:sulfatase maturation enzyme AslB (radical SAM superfamily)
VTSTICDQVTQRLRPFVQDQGPSAGYVRRLLRLWLPYLEAFALGRSIPPFEIEIQMSSRCNLNCRWCIGAEVQQSCEVKSLPDNLNDEAMERILKELTEFRPDGFGIEMVKFSGFIGEPLLPKCRETTLRAMQRLVGAQLKVGLFTNGIHMTGETWRTLAGLHYVNVSLDAGPTSFFWLKEERAGLSFTERTFHLVLENIAGLNQERLRRGTTVNITVSYVIIPGNHHEILQTAHLVRDAGADAIRFKCDIGGKHRLGDGGIRKEAFAQLDRVKNELETDKFAVTIIHEEQDVVSESYRSWNRQDGCFYHQLVGTLGSDGNLYLCDHNTMPGAIPLGNVINEPFSKVWNGPQRQFVTNGIPHACRSPVCPPFANATNFFLREIRREASAHGGAVLVQALRRLQSELPP